jgi:hypothetical protein
MDCYKKGPSIMKMTVKLSKLHIVIIVEIVLIALNLTGVVTWPWYYIAIPLEVLLVAYLAVCMVGVMGILLHATTSRLAEREVAGIELNKIYYVQHRVRDNFYMMITGANTGWIRGNMMNDKMEPCEVIEVMRKLVKLYKLRDDQI